MRKLIAAAAAAGIVAGGLAYAVPAQASPTRMVATFCSVLRCPPVPDKDCGITGQLCIPRMGPHRTHR